MAIGKYCLKVETMGFPTYSLLSVKVEAVENYKVTYRKY